MAIDELHTEKELAELKKYADAGGKFAASVTPSAEQLAEARILAVYPSVAEGLAAALEELELIKPVRR